MPVVVFVLVVMVGFAHAEERLAEWSFQLHVGGAFGETTKKSGLGQGAIPELESGIAYGFTAQRLGPRFGWGVETSNTRLPSAGPADTLHIDRYIASGIAVLPLSDRSRILASAGVGAIRNDFDKEAVDQWSPGIQLRLGGEHRLDARNWIGLQSTLWTARDIEGDFGAGPAELSLNGADVTFTYRRTY